MVSLNDLVTYCNNLLDIHLFKDYCPNGLQVEGSFSVSTIVTGVTACQALLDAAVEAKADLILVHHGYFWKGENQPIVGFKKRRIQTLLTHDISLLAYHLPLDGHATLGNNIVLGQRLNIATSGRFGSGSLGCYGQWLNPLTAEEVCDKLAEILCRPALHIAGKSEKIQTLAWCTGAAQSYIEDAHALGVDAYLSGEISEQTVHLARELGIHYFAAGHHATERYGVQALGEHLAQQFSLTHQFIDIDNPV